MLKKMPVMLIGPATSVLTCVYMCVYVCVTFKYIGKSFLLLLFLGSSRESVLSRCMWQGLASLPQCPFPRPSGPCAHSS